MADMKELASLYANLLEERRAWDSAWSELAKYFLPTRCQSFSGTPNRPLLNDELVDSTGVMDMRTLVAGLHGGLTCPSRPWFSFKLSGNEEKEIEGASQWLHEAENRVASALHRSNFYNAVHSLYADLATFGTALMLETCDWDGLHFELVPAGTYVLDTDAKGRVDTFFRQMSMTLRQLEEAFGDSLPPTLLQMKERSQNSSARFEVVHGVLPRKNGRIDGDSKHLPFASVYWMPDFRDDEGPYLLKESGFAEFPAFAPRWDMSSGDVYGASPAMDVLPDCRMLQAMASTLLKLQHKIADPPLAVDASLLSSGVELTPGGVNYVQNGRDASNAIAAIQQPDPSSLRYTMESIESVRACIHSGLYADLLKMMLSNEGRQMTAQEVASRDAEKLVLIGPVIERVHNELLAPVLHRTFKAMNACNAFSAMPDGLKGRSVRIEFVSVLAREQKKTSSESMEGLLRFVSQGQKLFPEIADAVNADSLVESFAESVCASPHLLRSLPERRALREKRRLEQEKAFQAEQIRQLIDTAEKAGEAVKSMATAEKAVRK